MFYFRHKTQTLNEKKKTRKNKKKKKEKEKKTKKEKPGCRALIHSSAWLCGSINSGQARVRSSLQLLSIKAFCSACSSVGNSFLFHSSTSLAAASIVFSDTSSRSGTVLVDKVDASVDWVVGREVLPVRKYGILRLGLKFGWVGRGRSFLQLPQTNDVKR